MKPNKIRPIDPECGQLMTVEEYLQSVQTNCLIDYDGFGHYSDGVNAYEDEPAYPSETARHGLKPGYTHVIWYNR